MLKFLVFANSILAVVTILSYLSGFVDPETSGYIALIGLLYPYLLILNLFMICFWLIVKWKNALISIFALLVGWSHMISFFGLGMSAQETTDGIPLTVSSFNINHSYYLKIKDEKLQKKRTKIFRDNFLNPETDVFCFQEYDFKTKKKIEALLPGYEQVWFKKNTVGLASKLPIVNSGQVPMLRGWSSCVYADVKIKDQIIRVYSIHLYSNKLTSKTEAIIEDREFNNEEAVEDIKFIFGSYINSSRKRVQEIAMLQSHFEKCPYPIVLCGDFNDTPQSYTYRQFKNMSLKDAFQEAGTGIGYTYGGSLPLLRIDYTFADEHFAVADHKVIRKKMSDHYPIETTLLLKE